MIRLIALLWLTLFSVSQPVSADVTVTKLPDGVVRYDKSDQSSTMWQYIKDNWGWVFSSQPWRRSVAFLVGVGDYAYLTPKLNYVGSDLKELRDFLLNEAGFDTVYIVQDSVASADLVDNYMHGTLPHLLTSEDRLLFYFSGHGADVGGRGFMLFAKAKNDFERSQYLPVKSAEEWGDIIPAKHVLFMIDACNSGLGYDTKAGNALNLDEELLAQFSGDGSRNVLTAGTGREKAYQVSEGNQQGYSVFTRAFLDAIRQTPNNSGFVTLTEVLAGVERRVKEFSRGSPARVMTPRVWSIPRQTGKDRGSFIFINPRAVRPVVPDSIKRYVSVDSKGTVDAPARPTVVGRGVKETIAAYRDAWQDMSIARIVEVFPSYAARNTFDDLASVAVAIGPAQIKYVSDTKAIAVCDDYSVTFTPKVGKKSQTKPQRVEFSLSKVGPDWHIDSVKVH